MFNVKKAAVAAAVGFALSFLLSIVATGKFGMAFLRGIIFAAVFAAGAIAIDFLNSRFLSGEGGEFPSLVPDVPQKKAGAKSAGNLVSIVIDDANLTEEPAAPDFDVSANGELLKHLDAKEKKTPKKEQQIQEQTTPDMQKADVQEKAAADVSAAENSDGSNPRSNPSSNPSSNPEIKKPTQEEGAPHGAQIKAEALGGSDKKPASSKEQSKKEETAPSAQDSETFKPMQLDAISGGAKKSESAAERKHERLQQIDELPDFAALTSGSEAQRDDELISDSEFAESEPDEDDGGEEDNVSSAPRGEIPVDYDSETIASAIRTLLKRDE